VSPARAARDGGVPEASGVPPPEPLPAPALDSHCHLDLIEQPAGEVVAAARAAGISKMITVGVDAASSRWSAACAAEHEGVYAAIAVHPNETAAADASRDAVLDQLAELARLPQVRAIGETGLDYYRDHAGPQVQQRWFRAHIDLAKRCGKALMIHDRDAHDDVLRILAEEGPPERVVFHCFSGDAAMAKRCAEAGYFMSFAGNVTFKNAQPLRDAAAAAPAGLLLVETDAPFLTPVPQRGKPNSPAMVAHTVRFLADVKQVGVEEMCALVTAAGERAFGPW
jgi:TatD DNase family protein